MNGIEHVGPMSISFELTSSGHETMDLIRLQQQRYA